ncbi:hypothetical protein VR46_23515 [Streptomyces sp. NRRL S-444]|nr:hypothetical protein VR46_23515 [Streptomyces sp. NRRL S-444]
MAAGQAPDIGGRMTHEEGRAMEDQGGAGGAPLHDHGDKERRRAPHVAPRAGADGKDLPPVRAADTDEASRLDRPNEPDKATEPPRTTRRRERGSAG